MIANEHTIRKARVDLGDDVEIWVGFAPPVNGHRAASIKTDPVHDLAILEVAVEIEGEVQERIAEARVGIRAFALGHDDQHIEADDFMFSRGVVKWMGPYVTEKNMLITSGTYPGPTPA